MTGITFKEMQRRILAKQENRSSQPVLHKAILTNREKDILRDRTDYKPDYVWTGTWQGPKGETEYVILKDGTPMEPGDVVNALNELEDIQEQVYRMAKD